MLSHLFDLNTDSSWSKADHVLVFSAEINKVSNPRRLGYLSVKCKVSSSACLEQIIILPAFPDVGVQKSSTSGHLSGLFTCPYTKIVLRGDHHHPDTSSVHSNG